jgi:hypothetical protein
MLQWYRYSEWLKFSVVFVIGTFRTHKHLCQPMDRVCSWDSLTDINVISVILSARRPEIPVWNVSCRCEIGFIISFLFTVCLISTKIVYRLLCCIIENFLNIFIFNSNIKKCVNETWVLICLSVSPSNYMPTWNNSTVNAAAFFKYFVPVCEDCEKKLALIKILKNNR